MVDTFIVEMSHVNTLMTGISVLQTKSPPTGGALKYCVIQQNYFIYKFLYYKWLFTLKMLLQCFYVNNILIDCINTDILCVILRKIKHSNLNIPWMELLTHRNEFTRVTMC